MEDNLLSLCVHSARSDWESARSAHLANIIFGAESEIVVASKYDAQRHTINSPSIVYVPYPAAHPRISENCYRELFRFHFGMRCHPMDGKRRQIIHLFVTPSRYTLHTGHIVRIMSTARCYVVGTHHRVPNIFFLSGFSLMVSVKGIENGSIRFACDAFHI